ncbi:MAG: hypothetical protein COV74_00650 [Candidatus Omnitrophica bacterium CG11_big_fil_rev_8_21_14_0_20_45_26]|uniref:Dipeptidylpeptidase IV N-terminal domain-containing protein n=1 Tax=Candidatus Abzuiibacterium crystallinum TaxID=1974748 RepID=A0A2H0LSV5_9BACT|nr:MAG: hypothetical protein COV74_00650 [Candidatus Omnitrophica bacterium CG11_big_fil_rev_8_21_14_0_20_45_26]
MSKPLFKISLLFFVVLSFITVIFNNEFALANSDNLIFTQLTDGYWQVWKRGVNGDLKQLTYSQFDKRRPVSSSDRKKIIYRSGNREIFIFDSQSGTELQVLSKLGWMMDPIFFGSDNKIIFSRFDSFLEDDSDLWVADVNSAESEILLRKQGVEFGPSLSSDNSKLVYVGSQGFGKSELYLLDLKTKKEKQLTSNYTVELYPSWSPDGELIVYASDESGNFNIFSMNINSGVTVELQLNVDTGGVLGV